MGEIVCGVVLIPREDNHAGRGEFDTYSLVLIDDALACRGLVLWRAKASI